jgi:excisionase family DNA binding protein
MIKQQTPIPPRGLTTRQAAVYWGVSYNTFRKLVRDGLVPPPMAMPELGRNLFDRLALDAAMDARSKRVAA